MNKETVLEKVKQEMIKGGRDFPQSEYDKQIDLIERPFPSDKERIEIILLKYKSPEMEADCIRKIIMNTNHPYKLTIFDNRNTTPNTSKAWNKLIKEATCEKVVIMDTDAFVSEGWLKPLADAIDHPEVAIAGPVCGITAANKVQQIKQSDKPPVMLDSGYISGYCFITTKTKIKEIGWFDEEFLVYGQDSEICDRILRMGKKMSIVPRSYVEHGKKIGKGYESSLSANKAAKEGEFNWEIDTRYAPRLCQAKQSDANTNIRG